MLVVGGIDIGQIWFYGFLTSGGILSAGILLIELRILISLAWSYIDERAFQLPKSVEKILKYIDMLGDRDLLKINNGDKEELMGLMFFGGFVGTVCGWIAALLWPIVHTVLLGMILLRTARFLRRTQKVTTKLVKLAHGHKANGAVDPADIKPPKF